jgi:hypothetical protein
MRTYVRTAFAAMCVTLLVACAASPPKEEIPVPVRLMEKGYVIGEKVRRVQNYRLHGWSYVDDRNLIIQSGVSRHYLVLLRSPCRDLDSAITIGFTSTVGALSDRDKVITRSAGFTDTCFIEGIWALEKINKEKDAD